ncbi:unnamed protein product [Mytilus coruscus]|uniref:Uncharacterized protein n=1 Tax=Mytilus coruscus TaxID=42192 RepID=A0A6J8A9K9_MYTCO|nr:unnamed protein product [Mytilus coruscus]
MIRRKSRCLALKLKSGSNKEDWIPNIECSKPKMLTHFMKFKRKQRRTYKTLNKQTHQKEESGNGAANRRNNTYQIDQDIYAFAMYLHYGLNVNYVVIGQLLYRSESVTYAGYNDKIIQINKLLQGKIKENDENAISFRHHHGFWDKLDFLCFDGVHLNHFGMRKYFKSVRSAVLHTSNQ